MHVGLSGLFSALLPILIVPLFFCMVCRLCEFCFEGMCIETGAFFQPSIWGNIKQCVEVGHALCSGCDFDARDG